MGITKGVVIIGLSGNARDVFTGMGQSAGMNDYVVRKNESESERERERGKWY